MDANKEAVAILRKKIAQDPLMPDEDLDRILDRIKKLSD